jgi:hypothetical protein
MSWQQTEDEFCAGANFDTNGNWVQPEDIWQNKGLGFYSVRHDDGTVTIHCGDRTSEQHYRMTEAQLEAFQAWLNLRA